jgi:cytochrome P450
MTKEQANPVTAISLFYPWLYKIASILGLISLQKCIDDLLEFSYKIIDDHKTKTIDNDALDFTETFLKKIQDNQDPKHPLFKDLGQLNLANIITDLFIAGSDTTANSMNWAMLFMILNPDVQTKVIIWTPNMDP